MLHFVREIVPGSGRRQRFVVLFVECDHFLDDSAQFVKYFSFIFAVTPAVKQSGGASHITPVLFRPFNDFDVLSVLFLLTFSVADFHITLVIIIKAGESLLHCMALGSEQVYYAGNFFRR